MPDSVGHLLLEALGLHRRGDPDDTYDETLRIVVNRAASEESLCKADIGSLVLWKRITAQARWSTDLGMCPDAKVRGATGDAWRLANNQSLSIPEAAQAARNALRDLPGLGGTGALASALLLACAPTRMAVWDRRVRFALEALGRRPTFGRDFFKRYLGAACSLVEEMQQQAGGDHGSGVTPRHVDLALYEIAGSQDLLARAQRLRSQP